MFILFVVWGIKFGKSGSPRNAPVSTQTGTRDLALHILKLDSKSWWLVRAMARLLFFLGKRPSVDCTGCWVGLGAGLDGNNALARD